MIHSDRGKIESIQALFLAARFLDRLVVGSNDVGLVNDASETHVVGIVDDRHTDADKFFNDLGDDLGERGSGAVSCDCNLHGVFLSREYWFR